MNYNCQIAKEPPTDWQREHAERSADAVEAIGPPIYGVAPAWSCYRSIGGFGSSNNGRHFDLRHRRDGVWVEVSTSTRPLPDDRSSLDRWFLTRTLYLDEVVFPLEVVVHRWEKAVDVDGAAVPFVFIGDEQTWIATAPMTNRHIEVDGRGLHPDDIALATVDLADYHDLDI